MTLNHIDRCASTLSAFLVALLLISCASDSPAGPQPPQTPGTSAGTPVGLEISPSALMLSASGQQHQLIAYAIDSAGKRSEVNATFESSNSGIVSVTPGGLATATASVGSSQIVARMGALTSAPLLAVSARPAAGALLVADSLVIGSLEAVNPAAGYAPGWRYRVRLRGTAPAVGQVVLGSQSALVAGRTISVADSTGYRVVTLELLPLRDMFQSLAVKQTIPLRNVRPRPASQSNGLRPSSVRTSVMPDFEFDLGSFECKATAGITAGNLSLEAGPLAIDPSLSLDVDVDATGVHRIAATGSIKATQRLKVAAIGTMAGSVDCHGIVVTIPFPVGGPLGFFIAGNLPLGVGFTFGGELTTANIGVAIDLVANGSVAVGVDCVGGCHLLLDLQSSTTGSSIKPILPPLSGAFKAKMSASAYGYTEFAIGNPIIETLQFGLAEAKLGLTQEFDIATREFQAADALYASSFTLKPLVSGGTTLEVQEAAGILGFAIPALKYEPELAPIAISPKGTFQVSPSSVRAANGSTAGEQTTFRLALEPVTYAGFYSVDEVEIRWKKTAANGTVTLEPGRPGCATIPVSQGQFTFTCSADFLAEHAGPQTFYAFVKGKIFGVPFPIPLEVATDGKAMVTVSAPAPAVTVAVTPTVVTVEFGGTRQFAATVTGSTNQSVTWAASGGTITTGGLFTAGSNTGQFSVTATSVANPSASGSAQVTVDAVYPIGPVYVGTRQFQGTGTEFPVGFIFTPSQTQMLQCIQPNTGNRVDVYSRACATLGGIFTDQSGYYVTNVTVSSGIVTGVVNGSTINGTIEGSKFTGRLSSSPSVFTTWTTTRR